MLAKRTRADAAQAVIVRRGDACGALLTVWCMPKQGEAVPRPYGSTSHLRRGGFETRPFVRRGDACVALLTVWCMPKQGEAVPRPYGSNGHLL
jgi:hypothetical protein